MRKIVWPKWLRRPPWSVKIAIFLGSTIAYGTAGYVFFERPDRPELTWLDGLWWSVVSMSTVGYGDHFPITTGGRFLVAYPVMLIGVGFLALALSQLARFFVDAESLNRKGKGMVKSNDHMLLVNYPGVERLGRVLRELASQPETGDRNIVLIDADLEELDPRFMESVQFVRGSIHEDSTCAYAGVASAKRAVVLAGDVSERGSDNAAVGAILSLKTFNPNIYVVAECVDARSEALLRRAGADSVVCVMNLAPGILVQESTDPGVVDVLSELTVWNKHVNNIYIVDIDKPQGAAYEGLGRWAKNHAATVLGYRRNDQVVLNPEPATVLVDGDAAVIVCRQRPTKICLTSL